MCDMEDDVDNQYTGEMMKIMYDLSKNKHLTDFVIRAGNTRVSCHRAVISTKSEYFDSLSTSGQNEVVLDYADEEHGQILEAIVRFMYLGRIDIESYNVESLIHASHLIKHHDLKRFCENFMVENLGLENFVSNQSLANKFSLSNLSNACIAFTKRKSSDVLKTDWILSLTVSEFNEYLQSDELNVSSEDEVIIAVQRWLRCTKAPSTVKDGYIDSLLPAIRLNHCNRSVLEELTKDDDALDYLKLKIFEYLHHGLHGDHTARPSYSNTGKPYMVPTSTAPKSTPSTAPKVSRPSIPPIPSFEYLHHGRHGDHKARPSYSTTGKPYMVPASTASKPAPSTTPKPSPPIPPRASSSTTSKSSAASRTQEPEPENEVLLIGGFTTNNEVHRNIMFLESGTPSPFSAYNGSYSICPTGDGLIASGGYDRSAKRSMSKVKIFDLTTRLWSDLPNLSQPKQFHGTSYACSRYYTVGGCYEKNGVRKYRYADVEVLDLETLQLSTFPSLPVAVSEPGVAHVHNKLLVFGGHTGEGWSHDTYSYDITTGERKTCQRIPLSGNVFHRTAVVDNSIYVLTFDRFQKYDVQKDTWTKLTSHPKPSNIPAMVLHENRLLVLGGYENDKNCPKSIIQTYDLATKKWSIEKRTMPVALWSHWALAVKMPKSK